MTSNERQSSTTRTRCATPYATRYANRSTPGGLLLAPLILLLAFATACGPDDLAGLDEQTASGMSTDSGETGSTPDGPYIGATTGDPVGDGDTSETGGFAEFACTSAAATIDCESAGDCWAIMAGWGTWAWYAEPARLQASIDSNQLALSGDDLITDATCYDFVGSEAHACVLCVDGVPLLGTSIFEIAIAENDCAGGYPWEYSGGKITDPDLACWGVIDNVAVLLNPN